VRLAWEAGRFSRLGVSWETLEALIEIKIDAPAVATRDALQMARTQEVQIGLGILSRQTAAAQPGSITTPRWRSSMRSSEFECGITSKWS